MKSLLRRYPRLYEFVRFVYLRVRGDYYLLRWSLARLLVRIFAENASFTGCCERFGRQGSTFANLLLMHRAATAFDVIGIGNRAEGRDVVMLVLSDLRIDPRVEREARALSGAGYRIIVICPEPFHGAAAAISIDWGSGVEIKLIDIQAAAFASYRPGYLAETIYREAVQHRPFAFHAHDLNMAYAALAAARQTGSHLVVDFHEWFSENVHWSERLKEWVPYPARWMANMKELEARCLREASATITVCDSIADAMLVELGGHRPHVIRNIPAFQPVGGRTYRPLKEELGIPEDSFLLLWQGGTGPTRLIDPIIEALADAPDCIFAIRGPSLDIYGPGYLALAERVGAGRRLLLLPPVPSQDVVSAAGGADAGIWNLPALCRNFTFALPNKIFEYVAAGLPVLAANYPEAARLVLEYDIGLTFDPYDSTSIARAINRLGSDRPLAAKFRSNVQSATTQLSALDEWSKLVRLYGGG